MNISASPFFAILITSVFATARSNQYFIRINETALDIIRTPYSPIFNKNYIFTSKSENSKYSLKCIPDQCSNNSDGLLIIKNNITNKNKSIRIKNVSGFSFVISNNGSYIYKIPTYIGFPKFSYDYVNESKEKIQAEFSDIKIFKINAKDDSIKIPGVVLTSYNKNFLLKDNQIDQKKIIRYDKKFIYITTKNCMIKINKENPVGYEQLDLNNFVIKKTKKINFRLKKMCV